MARRALQEINAGSMADIAFLLLIFYLVTTTMETNTGMTRKLPRIPETTTSDVPVKERNVFVVLLNKSNRLFVEDELTNVGDLCEKTKKFFLNPTHAENLPEFKEKDIPYFGKVQVSKGIVSLIHDRGTTYEKYIKVQDQLVKAVNELRDDLAMKKWQKHFDELEKDQQKAIKTYFPMALSDAEPVEIK